METPLERQAEMDMVPFMLLMNCVKSLHACIMQLTQGR